MINNKINNVLIKITKLNDDFQPILNICDILLTRCLFFFLYSGARSRPRRRSLLFGEPRGTLGCRRASGPSEMRGSAKLACQVFVENRRTAARS